MQYCLLIQIDKSDKREYYEYEALNNGWTGREFYLPSEKQLLLELKKELNKNHPVN
jgi:predicted nuclease of restriction endonuclease-like (RecB) superfamily